MVQNEMISKDSGTTERDSVGPGEFDDNCLSKVSEFLIAEGARQLPHSGRTLFDHLDLTGYILRAWRQPLAVQVGGLLHSIYSTPSYHPALVSLTQRKRIATLVGDQAEYLAYHFAATSWPELLNRLNVNGYIPDEGVLVNDRFTGTQVSLPSQTLSRLLVIQMANTAEQSRGDSNQPGLWLASVSNWGNMIRNSSDCLPPVFDSCSQIIRHETEASARAAYLSAVAAMRTDRPTALIKLDQAIDLCPWIGEPLVWRAYLALAGGDTVHATSLAQQAFTLFSQWGTSWDKRAVLDEWQSIAGTIKSRHDGLGLEDLLASSSADLLPAFAVALQSHECAEKNDNTLTEKATSRLPNTPSATSCGSHMSKGEDDVDFILKSLSSSEFITDYWGKTPFYLRGSPDRFNYLFSLERLEECLLQISESRRSDVLVHMSPDHGCTQIPISTKEAISQYRKGATICVTNLSAVDTGLQTLAAKVKSATKFLGTVDVRAYLSPDGQGFRNHFDARVATTLQIEGKKRWRYSLEPALAWPPYQVTPGPSGEVIPSRSIQSWETFKQPSDCTFEEVVLEPGDILCLPAGTWHSAEAVDYSLALNLAFGFETGFWPKLATAISWTLRPSALWREPPPLAPPGSVAGLEESYRDFLLLRVTELIETLEDMKANPWALDAVWKLINNPSAINGK